jgi:hypothetical protein
VVVTLIVSALIAIFGIGQPHELCTQGTLGVSCMDIEPAPTQTCAPPSREHPYGLCSVPGYDLGPTP